MSRTDDFPYSPVAVLHHFVLLLHCILWLLSLVPNTPHSVDVHTEAEDDKTKDDDEKSLRVLVGELLYLGSELVQLTPTCEPSTSINFPIVLFFVLRIIFVGHFLADDEFLPTSQSLLRLV